ncbi:peptidase C13 [Luteimonas yindakuii]|uniref:Peptidase C13 n=1 Tax=Luteimonas yindakuii TaxID=2565782 RepID=A0A4Z1RGS2_9GAMM|nr:C13 family peptidase [Luteimonas yindakuii]TKS53877.1 peptidase C13 [Luteimonas yindakuii]
MSIRPVRGRWRLPALLLGAALALPACAQPADDGWDARDRQMIDRALAELPTQRPGITDLYVLGFAGDGQEDVFRNEVLHLQQVAATRLGNGGRTLLLVNHPDSLGEDAPHPLATRASLRYALAGLGQAMDADEDILLLFATTHGSEDHELAAVLPPMIDEGITPADLRDALDDAGIRHRVLVVSACFSGGFIRDLEGPDTLMITAASADRPSFGCGAEADLTYFGRAWLVDGLNAAPDFIGAYDVATRGIADREREAGFEASLPQISIGSHISRRLQQWQATMEPGPPVPFTAPPVDP